MEKLHETIEKLSAGEARSLLLNILFRIKIMRKLGVSNEERVGELFTLYDEIIGGSQKAKAPERGYAAVHIVCGESPAGSMRSGLGRSGKVIGFPDFFAVGPIWQLHKEAGRNHRYEWLRDNLNMEMDYMEEEYESRFFKTLAEIETIPDNVPIVVWTAENADEQAGALYFIHLLKGKANDIYLINTTIAYQELLNLSEAQSNVKHSGEGTPETFRRVVEEMPRQPLTTQEKEQMHKEWIDLSGTNGLLRIWENGEIKSVQEDYFDSFIINTAQTLHTEQGHKDFIKAGRVIGEALGHSEQVISDTFLEYRLRHLIYDGTFEIKGIPKSMRHYSVKLK